MKNKLLIAVAAIVSVFACFPILSCGGADGDGHTHSYVDYVYNNDGTCLKDGTETAKCEFCEKTDTRKSAEHTAAGGHSFTDYVCDVCGEYASDAPITEGLEFTVYSSSEYGVDGSYLVSGIGSVTDSKIIVPRTYNDKPVVGIGFRVFFECDALISVALPNTVANISERAFECCSRLQSIRLPSGLKTIGDGAFRDCYSLTGVEIPRGVTSIGTGAFAGCDGLMNIKIPNAVAHMGRDVFAGDGCVTIYCEAAEKPDGWNEEFDGISTPIIWDCVNNDLDEDGYAYTVEGKLRYKLKDGIASVDSKQPYSVGGAVTVQSSIEYNGRAYAVTSIGKAFTRLYANLTRVTIPKSIETISSGAFGGSRIAIYCEAEQQPSGWENLWNNYNPVVWDCNKNNVDESGYAYAVSDDILYRLNSGKTAEIIGGQQNVYKESITVPSSVEYDGDDYRVIKITNFPHFYGLKSVDIRQGVTEIAENSFEGMESLQNIEIPDSVTVIGRYAFHLCSGLSSVKLSNRLNAVGERAFEACSELTEIEIPVSVADIGAYVFSSCGKLVVYCQTEEKPSDWDRYWNKTEFGNYSPVVWDCVNNEADGSGTVYAEIDGIRYGLKGRQATVLQQQIVKMHGDVVIPASVKYNKIDYAVTGVAEYAFRKCVAIKSVTVPSSVATVGSEIFRDCVNSLTVFCEAEKKPDDWADDWAGMGALSEKVVWDCKNK